VGEELAGPVRDVCALLARIKVSGRRGVEALRDACGYRGTSQVYAILAGQVRTPPSEKRVAAWIACCAREDAGLAAAWMQEYQELAGEYRRQARRAAAADPRRARSTSARAGWRRVEESDPYRLGVHRPIQVPEVVRAVLPTYVPRDVDAGAGGVRARLAAAAERGGFVLLVGDSSAGKTRTAYEAVRAVLPGWWLVHPADPAAAAALADHDPSRLVVWLDEVESYLDGAHALSAGVVERLLDGPGPVVLVATIWPDRFARYCAPPARDDDDPYRRQRALLRLADPVSVPHVFSPAERERAARAADGDPRLRAALAAPGYGLTQTLAAAPQLVDRWEHAASVGGPRRGPYRRAVLTAALDAARLGARAPLTATLLRAAALDYCAPGEQARAPSDWFDDALAYATDNTQMHGAAAALDPVGPGMGQVSGYVPAGFLLQHAARVRRAVGPPPSLWIALRDELTHPDDVDRIATAAYERGIYAIAEPLLRARADAGDEFAAYRLAEILAAAGDVEGLHARAAVGEEEAAARLAWAHIDAGDPRAAIEVFRVQADAGDRTAARRLAKHLEKLGDVDGLRARADAGEAPAAVRLAGLLANAGDVDELRARAEAGDGYSACQYARLLADSGDRPAAIAVLRPLAGFPGAADLLSEMLVDAGELPAAIDLFAARADAGDRSATVRLVGLLAQAGNVEELRARAKAGGAAVHRLAAVLAGGGNQREAIDVLRPWADDGDRAAAARLADLLVEAGDITGLRARAEAGDHAAIARLVTVAVNAGDRSTAIDLLRPRVAADDWFARRLATLLAEAGDVEELRVWADSGGRWAAAKLADLLAEAGDVEELRARVDAGDHQAAVALARQLAFAGDDRLARFGFRPDGSIADRAEWRLARRPEPQESPTPRDALSPTSCGAPAPTPPLSPGSWATGAAPPSAETAPVRSSTRWSA